MMPFDRGRILQATAVAEARAEAGNVILNHWQVKHWQVNHWKALLPGTPFGGCKESDAGSESGVEGLQAFQNVKYVSRFAG
jgi:succinate-semialdehyde dehydrogenase/glutarate-semialdehyde dehydrogenase